MGVLPGEGKLPVGRWYAYGWGGGMLPDARRIASRYFRAASIYDLDQYLRKDEADRGLELALGYSDAFDAWVRRTYALGETGEDTIDEILEGDSALNLYAYLDDLDASILEGFYKSLSWERDLRGDLAYAPSWYLMEKPKDFHGSLIHFTDHPEAVARQGFRVGEPDPSRLSLTRHLDDHGGGEGFNFAYDVEDWERYAPKAKGGLRYGQGAVVFNANGTKVWHKGDQEPQVIFWGSDAEDLNAIVQTPEGWSVGGSLYATLPLAVAAVV